MLSACVCLSIDGPLCAFLKSIEKGCWASHVDFEADRSPPRWKPMFRGGRSWSVVVVFIFILIVKSFVMVLVRTLHCVIGFQGKNSGLNHCRIVFDSMM